MELKDINFPSVHDCVLLLKISSRGVKLMQFLYMVFLLAGHSTMSSPALMVDIHNSFELFKQFSDTLLSHLSLYSCLLVYRLKSRKHLVSVGAILFFNYR